MVSTLSIVMITNITQNIFFLTILFIILLITVLGTNILYMIKI